MCLQRASQSADVTPWPRHLAAALLCAGPTCASHRVQSSLGHTSPFNSAQQNKTVGYLYKARRKCAFPVICIRLLGPYAFSEILACPMYVSCVINVSDNTEINNDWFPIRNPPRPHRIGNWWFKNDRKSRRMQRKQKLVNLFNATEHVLWARIDLLLHCVTINS